MASSKLLAVSPVFCLREEQSERLDVPLLEAVVDTHSVKTDLPLYGCAARADADLATKKRQRRETIEREIERLKAARDALESDAK